MIWLASFPRSGNTFFRNVLYEVYGLESSTYHNDPDRSLDLNYTSFPFVKTHLLPDQLEPNDPNIPAVYLIRDGRDALVSLAHHRKDIVEPGSDFTHNLLEALVARGHSHFGGWSTNVEAWSKRASIIIKFEDLIENPIREIEKLRSIIELPAPNMEKLPDFQSLKFGRPKYGAGHSESFDPEKAKFHFRRGSTNSFSDEMEIGIQKLFWGAHGMTMTKFGYGSSPFESKKKNILIEGSKFFNQHMDGIGRYIQSLVRFLPILLHNQKNWDIDLLHKNDIIPVFKAQKERNENPEHLVLEHEYETKLLKFKKVLKKVLPHQIYSPLRHQYVRGPWRKWLKNLRLNVNRKQIKKLRKNLSEVNKDYHLIHAPIPQGLMKVREMGKNFISTVHDTTHIALSHWHDDANVQETEEGMDMIKDLNAHIISVSNSTKKDIISQYQVKGDNITVVYEGIDPDVFHPKWKRQSLPHLDEKYGIPSDDFILSLSTLEPRKNISATIEAFQKLKQTYPHLKTNLVIAGRKGWKWENILTSYNKLKDHILFTGYIEEEDLPYLYGRAKVFCYPSHYEGFGLPLLEAMGCGTPVIYGANSAMKEIVGEAGLGVSSLDTNAIMDAMFLLLTDETYWKEMSLNSRIKANQYTWLKCAYHTIQCFDNQIES